MTKSVMNKNKQTMVHVFILRMLVLSDRIVRSLCEDVVSGKSYFVNTLCTIWNYMLSIFS